MQTEEWLTVILSSLGSGSLGPGSIKLMTVPIWSRWGDKCPILAEDTVIERANPVEIHNLFHW